MPLEVPSWPQTCLPSVPSPLRAHLCVQRSSVRSICARPLGFAERASVGTAPSPRGSRQLTSRTPALGTRALQHEDAAGFGYSSEDVPPPASLPLLGPPLQRLFLPPREPQKTQLGFYPFRLWVEDLPTAQEALWDPPALKSRAEV